MERKFAIVIDSAGDMPPSYYQKHEVEVVPLGFTIANRLYEGECGEHITEKKFYALLREGAMPTTYQVTAEVAKPYIEKYLKKGEDVLVLAFSSALSGTAGSFLVAARELAKKYPKRKIEVVDTLCASMGEGLLLDYVVKKADTGAKIEEVKRYAEEIKLRIRHHFTVDNLFHLKRGGRISATTAVLGSVLKIKPIMTVNAEGKLVALSKVIGRKKSLTALVENLCKEAAEDEPIFISHGDCIEDAEYVKKLILAKLPKAKITVHYIGAVIGAHAGAGTVAIFHLAKSNRT